MQWVLGKRMSPRILALATAAVALTLAPIGMANHLFPSPGGNTPSVHPPFCPPVC
jgi:hypothetical protein